MSTEPYYDDGQCVIYHGDCRVRAGTAFLHKQNGGPRPDSNSRLLDGHTYDEFPVTA